jgi:transposase-like protein
MRRSYSDEERQAALDLYETDGPTAVERQLGIHKGTVTKWAKATGVETRCLETKRKSVAASRLHWEQRRADMAHQIGDVAALALERVEQALEGPDIDVELMIRERGPKGEMVDRIPNPNDAKNLATTMAILVDKAQLLTGGVTGRTDNHDVRHQALTEGEERGLRLVG